MQLISSNQLQHVSAGAPTQAINNSAETLSIPDWANWPPNLCIAVGTAILIFGLLGKLYPDELTQDFKV